MTSSSAKIIIPFNQAVTYIPSNANGGDNSKWLQPLEHFSRPAQIPELYQRSVTIGGQAILPIFAIEPQIDHLDFTPNNNFKRKNANKALMKRVQDHAQFCVQSMNDTKSDDRIFIQRAKKFAMHNNGDHGDHDRRKVVCTGTMRNLLAECHAKKELAFLDATLANGFKLDDLSDALSGAIETGVEFFSSAISRIHGIVLPEKYGLGQVDFNGQSLRVLYTDTGTRHFARCLVEIVHLSPASTQTYVTDANETKSHLVSHPHFRILRWQLIDLQENRLSADYKGSSALLKYEHRPGVNVTASAYDPNDIVRAEKAVARAAAKAERKQRDQEEKKAAKKRKREESAVKKVAKKRKRDEGDAPVKRVTKKRKKGDESFFIDLALDSD
jgi:hypothetical protein